jgi:TonB-dependent starch-binding outer membrane protein SusC
MKNVISTILFIFLYLADSKAQRLVKGNVINARNQEVIQGAKIQILDSDLSVQSDQLGNFAIVVPSDKKNLVVSCLGFIKQQIDINNRNTVAVLLKESGFQNRKVSIAYGSLTQAQSTEAITNINIEEVRNQPVLDINRALQGRTAGLNLKMTSGMPASGLIASIRGNLNPLYIIDGVPKLDEDLSIFSKGYDYNNNYIGNCQAASSIVGINIFDIESVEVLKDASALALYGARAANGVILIHTKQGKSEKPEYEFNTFMGFQQIARPLQFMNAQEFKALVEEARYNDIMALAKDPSVFGKDFDRSILTNPLENFKLFENINTNWMDVVTRIAPINNHNFSVKGGKKLRYYGSLGYYDQSGIVIENGIKRISGRINLDYTVNSRLSLGTRLMSSYSVNKRSITEFDYNNVMTNALLSSPFMPLYNKDGSYTSENDYEANYAENGYKLAKETYPFTRTSSVMASLFGEYQVGQNVKFRSSFSMDNVSLDENYYRSAFIGSVANFNGRTQQSNTSSTTILNENILTYDYARNNHTFKLLGGLTGQKTSLENQSQIGNGFDTEGGEKKISDAQEVSNINSAQSYYILYSFLSRINYGYAKRFFFTASMRSDGSSRFSKNKKFGLFPSFSASWNVSNKEDWEDSKIGQSLNALKIRLSFGVLGDQNIGDFKSQTLFEAKIYDGKTAWVLKSIGDPNLTWQSNKMLNAGVDFELTKNRLTGSIDIYQSEKTNLLYEKSIPSTNGQASVLSNNDSEINQGIELNLASVLVKKDKFKWESQFNISFNKSKLITDAEPTLIYADVEIPATHILQNNEPIGSIIAVKHLGVNPQTGENEFEDFNKDGVIDSQDAQLMGSGVPTWHGGWSNNFLLGKFDFSIFFRFSGGNKVFNIFRDESENLGWSNDGELFSVYGNNTTNVINRWRKPGDIAEYGKASFINKNFIRNSSRVIEDGSFLRLQNITLGYNFSFFKDKIKSRLFLTAQNVFILTKYKGFDPEVSSAGNKTLQTVGLDYAAYPQAKTFVIGGSFRF